MSLSILSTKKLTAIKKEKIDIKEFSYLCYWIMIDLTKALMKEYSDPKTIPSFSLPLRCYSKQSKFMGDSLWTIFLAVRVKKQNKQLSLVAAEAYWGESVQDLTFPGAESNILHFLFPSTSWLITETLQEINSPSYLACNRRKISQIYFSLCTFYTSYATQYICISQGKPIFWKNNEQ